MKILYTAFNGKQNSSKLLLDAIESDNKLYLKNSFNTSVAQLEAELKKNDYDLIISFGQLLLNVNKVRIEKSGLGEREYKTTYDYSKIRKTLEKNGYHVMISNHTTYLCNNIYYHGLKYIDDNKLKTKMIFIHIPKMKFIEDISSLATAFIKDNL